MSAILSAEALNDFISPGVACIKPFETTSTKRVDSSSTLEVTTEGRDHSDPTPSASPISLTDCLACSGCVTSAEAVLVSLQSHAEVANTLDAFRSVNFKALKAVKDDVLYAHEGAALVGNQRIFIASVSPQARASLAAAYKVNEQEAGNMIQQLLAGPGGLKSDCGNGPGFTWVIDTNNFRDICRIGLTEEVFNANCQDRRPILSSACPGWVCYAEKTHPHILPHISQLKSPQALAGIMLKSFLNKRFGIPTEKIWHLAIMPCFDKKLEASREELTDKSWKQDPNDDPVIRDVDCVITARELLLLAEAKGLCFQYLPRQCVFQEPFPDPIINQFLFSTPRRERGQERVQGSSGGYAYQILLTQCSRVPGSRIEVERGRNADVVEYSLIRDGVVLMKTARYYGFRNIQNLVRKLKPANKSRIPGATSRLRESRRATLSQLPEYAFVEVMACPGGCTNGGGQIKYEDTASEISESVSSHDRIRDRVLEQKEWLRQVDEAYYSGASDTDTRGTSNASDLTKLGHHDMDANHRLVNLVVDHLSSTTDIPRQKLLYTTYRKVDNDFGNMNRDKAPIVAIAGTAQGGW